MTEAWSGKICTTGNNLSVIKRTGGFLKVYPLSETTNRSQNNTTDIDVDTSQYITH